MSGGWGAAAGELLRGGLVIYPTETFYALGCLATLHAAAERIFEVKGRPGGKPLPLIIADWDMAGRYLRLRATEMALARAFWPGPLSIVTEVDPSVSPLARDVRGRSAVRMSPHPIATGLCLAAGAPLVSSSANLSGGVAVSRPGDLDPELLRRSDAMVLDAMPWPAGGLPSTLVEVADGRPRILRPGALTASAIAGKGFDVLVE